MVVNELLASESRGEDRLVGVETQHFSEVEEEDPLIQFS